MKTARIMLATLAVTITVVLVAFNTKSDKMIGITAASIARMARVPYEAVAKRVYDLREHYTIYTNWRKVNGKRTAFYRLAN